MAQRQPWFRARRGDQGTGYSLIHWKGGVAVVLIALFCSGLGALPALLRRVYRSLAYVAAAILVISLFETALRISL
ncbi:MAG TPA: hypothetical protein VGF50_12700, partial [Caulobacteraceae bacterium]